MAVTAEIRGRNKQFLSVVDQSKRQLRELRSVAGKGFTLGGALGFTALFAGMKKVADEFDRIEKLSRRLGVSIAETQKLEFIGSQNGANLENLTRTLLQIERRIGEGGSAAAEAFERLGINVDEFIKLGPTARLVRLGEALEDNSDHAATLADLFAIAGRNGEELVQVVALGADALRDLGSAATVVGDDEVKKIAAFNDQLDQLGKRARAAAGFALSFVQSGADAAGAATAGIGNFADRLFDVGPIDAFNESLRITDEALTDLQEERAGRALLDTPLAQAVAGLQAEIKAIEEKRRIEKLSADERRSENARNLEDLKASVDANIALAESIRARDGDIAASRQADKDALEGKRDYLKLLEEQEKLEGEIADAAEKRAADINSIIERNQERTAELRNDREVDPRSLEEQLVDEKFANSGTKDRLGNLQSRIPYADTPDKALELRQEISEVELLIEESLTRQADLAERISTERLEGERELLALAESEGNRRLSGLEDTKQKLDAASTLTDFERAGGRFEGSENLPDGFAEDKLEVDSEIQRQIDALDSIKDAIDGLQAEIASLELRHEESQHG